MFAHMCVFVFVVHGGDMMLWEEWFVVGMASWSEKFGIGAPYALKADDKGSFGISLMEMLFLPHDVVRC